MERTSIILMLRHEFSVNSVTCDIIERKSCRTRNSEKKRSPLWPITKARSLAREAGAGLLCEREKRSERSP
jgi:hypothetical protein